MPEALRYLQSGGYMEKQKKKRTAGDVIRTLIMVVALCVFCYSGFQLFSIYREYKMEVTSTVLSKKST